MAPPIRNVPSDNGPRKRNEDQDFDATREAGESTNEFAKKSAEAKTELNYEFLGPYRVIQKIGEGGMGSVFLAEQEVPIRRQVAVKVIKHQHGSSQIIARFETERQALAMMDHPNIAKVLDAGTATDGSPYFAMELVTGRTLLDHVQQRKLDRAARLDLLARIGDAVQYAHEQGIVHRDLKPANILVEEATGQPKILDFGVARVTDADLKATTLQTREGQLLGTVPYMSPEQLSG